MKRRRRIMFTQYQLPYGLAELEPVIDKETVLTHHGKHHKTYTATFNTLAAQAGVEGKTVPEILSELDKIDDDALRAGLRNNGGGFFNHNLYFETLTPGGKALPDGPLKEAIDRDLGGFEKMKEDMSLLALSQFGSGWAWLSVTPDKKLVLSKTPNQDNDYSLKTGNTPIFTIDVWEHAYYLKYKNLRADYVNSIWSIVDWEAVEKKFAAI